MAGHVHVARMMLWQSLPSERSAGRPALGRGRNLKFELEARRGVALPGFDVCGQHQADDGPLPANPGAARTLAVPVRGTIRSEPSTRLVPSGSTVSVVMSWM